MVGETTLSLCIADMNELLTKAMREHVFRTENYDVVTVDWNEREMSFKVTLRPRPALVPVQVPND